MDNLEIDKQFAFLQTARHSIEVLEELGFEFELVDDQEHEWLLAAIGDTEIGRVRVAIGILEDPGQWMLTAYHPLVIVSSLRPTTSELLMRFNQEMAVGSWEINWDTGHVRVRSGTFFHGRTLPKEEVSLLIQNALYSLLEFHTPLVQTIFDGHHPNRSLLKNLNNQKTQQILENQQSKRLRPIYRLMNL